MVGVISVFGASIVGVIFLLALKAWEMRREHVVAPRLRAKLDAGALFLKSQIEKGEAFLAELPSLASFVAMKTLAGGSVHLAHLARRMSESAYRLADFISHKHNFERRETRSEFLKTMIEHKNGLTNGLSQPIVNAVKKRRVRKASKVPTQVAQTVTEVQE
jgi:hypothetical protein